ncbi:MAG: glycosyltransferase 87 family protein [Bdellovibrionota bacterium]
MSEQLTNDFSTYWIYFQALISGINIYDFSAVQAFAKSLDMSLTGPSYFGPWVLPLLAPVLCWSLETSFFLHFCLNICLVFASSNLLISLYPEAKRSQLFNFLLALSFCPVAFTILIGQHSIFILFGILLALTGIQDDNSLKTALGLVLASIKFHLVYLLWPLFFLYLIQSKQIKAILYFGLILISLLLITEAYYQGSTNYWISNSSDALKWKGASLITILRLILGDLSNNHAAYLGILIPLIVLILFFPLYRNNLNKKSIIRLCPRLLVLSLITTPYVWLFDFCLGLPLFMLSLNRGYFTGFLINLLGLLCLSIGIVDYRMFWFPLAILCTRTTAKER